jgi:hypothetical protein
MTDRTLTVAELIAVLSRMPQDLPVEMGMNMEYQCGVSADMVEVFETAEGDRICYITDTPGY